MIIIKSKDLNQGNLYGYLKPLWQDTTDSEKNLIWKYIVYPLLKEEEKEKFLQNVELLFSLASILKEYAGICKKPKYYTDARNLLEKIIYTNVGNTEEKFEALEKLVNLSSTYLKSNSRHRKYILEMCELIFKNEFEQEKIESFYNNYLAKDLYFRNKQDLEIRKCREQFESILGIMKCKICKKNFRLTKNEKKRYQERNWDIEICHECFFP